MVRDRNESSGRCNKKEKKKKENKRATDKDKENETQKRPSKECPPRSKTEYSDGFSQAKNRT